MRRRDLVAGLAGIAFSRTAWGRPAEGLRRIGLLTAGERDVADVTAFRQRLDQLGWRDPGNARIEHRWAGGNPGRLPGLAQDSSVPTRRSRWFRERAR